MKFEVIVLNSETNAQVTVVVDLPADTEVSDKSNPKTIAGAKARIAVCDVAGIEYNPEVHKVVSVEEIEKEIAC